MRYDTLTGPQAWLRVSYFRCSRGIPESDQSLLGSLIRLVPPEIALFWVCRQEGTRERSSVVTVYQVVYTELLSGKVGRPLQRRWVIDFFS